MPFFGRAEGAPNILAKLLLQLKTAGRGTSKDILALAQLKAAARLCQFTAQCECSKAVEFTDMIVLYKLVAGIVDEELQKELLTKADLTLAEAEKMAVAAESAKDSMVSIHSEMGVLKVAKQNQQQLSSFDQVSFRFHIWLTTH